MHSVRVVTGAEYEAAMVSCEERHVARTAQRDATELAASQFASSVMLRVKAELHHRAIVVSDLFHRIDTDGSARVHRLSLLRGLGSVGIHLTDLESRACFDRLDRDGNGEVDWREFKALLLAAGDAPLPMPEGSEARARPLPARQIAHAVALLRVAAYRSGGVDLAYFFSVLWSKRRAEGLSALDFRQGLRRARVGYDCLRDEDANRLFRQIDTDGDGRVSLVEFVAFIHLYTDEAGINFKERRRSLPADTLAGNEAHRAALPLARRVSRHISSRLTSARDIFDDAQSAFVSRTIFAKGLESVGIFLTREELDDLIGCLGSDGAGRVSWMPLDTCSALTAASELEAKAKRKMVWWDQNGVLQVVEGGERSEATRLSKWWDTNGLPRVRKSKRDSRAKIVALAPQPPPSPLQLQSPQSHQSHQQSHQQSTSPIKVCDKKLWRIKSSHAARDLNPEAVKSPTAKMSPTTTFGPGLPFSTRGRCAALYSRATVDPAAQRLINLVRREARRRAMSSAELFSTAARDSRRGSATTLHRVQLVRLLEDSLAIFLTLHESKLLTATLGEDADGEITWLQFEALFGDADEMAWEATLKLATADVVRVVRHVIAAGYTTGGVDLTRLFEHLHLHRRKNLNFGDFSHALRRSHVSYERPSDDQLRSLFHMIDSNGDGAISLQEFASFVRRTARAHGIEFREVRSQRGQPLLVSPKKKESSRPIPHATRRVALHVEAELHHRAIVVSDLFHRIDTDGSARVHRLELVRGLANVGIHLNDSEGLALFDWLDRDGDGSVDWKEFEDLLGSAGDDGGVDGGGEGEARCGAAPIVVKPLSQLQVSKAIALLRVAAYRCGGVDLEHFFTILWSKRRTEGLNALEFRRGLRRARVGHDCLCDAEIKQLFREVDENDDGRISLDEFVTWVHRCAKATNVAFKERTPLRTIEDESKTKELLALATPSSASSTKKRSRGQQVIHRVMRELHHRAIVVSDLFHRIDTDGSSYIHIKELCEGFASVGIELNSEENAILFRTLDRNGDGKIDWFEFSGLYNGNERSEREAGRSPASQSVVIDVVRRIRSAAFTVGKVNVAHIFPRARALSLEGFRRGIRRAGVSDQRVADAELSHLFRTLDRECVGVIDVCDFIKFSRAHQTRATAVVTTRKVVRTIVQGAAAVKSARQQQLDRQLLAAIRKMTLERVQRLVSEGANVNSKGRLKTTPLHFAAESGSDEIVRFLVAAGASTLTRDQYAMRPRAWAIRCGHEKVAHFLEENERPISWGLSAFTNSGALFARRESAPLRVRSNVALCDWFISIDHWTQGKVSRVEGRVYIEGTFLLNETTSSSTYRLWFDDNSPYAFYYIHRIIIHRQLRTAVRDTHLQSTPVSLDARFSARDDPDDTAPRTTSIFVRCGVKLPLLRAPELVDEERYGLAARYTYWRVSVSAAAEETLKSLRARNSRVLVPYEQQSTSGESLVATPSSGANSSVRQETELLTPPPPLSPEEAEGSLSPDLAQFESSKEADACGGSSTDELEPSSPPPLTVAKMSAPLDFPHLAAIPLEIKCSATTTSIGSSEEESDTSMPPPQCESDFSFSDDEPPRRSPVLMPRVIEHTDFSAGPPGLALAEKEAKQHAENDRKRGDRERASSAGAAILEVEDPPIEIGVSAPASTSREDDGADEEVYNVNTGYPSEEEEEVMTSSTTGAGAGAVEEEKSKERKKKKRRASRRRRSSLELFEAAEAMKKTCSVPSWLGKKKEKKKKQKKKNKTKVDEEEEEEEEEENDDRDKTKKKKKKLKPKAAKQTRGKRRKPRRKSASSARAGLP